MKYKKIIILIIFSDNILYNNNNYASQKKHDHLLKKNKKKKHEVVVSIEKLHEEWEKEYKELEPPVTNQDIHSLQVSPQNSSGKSSLESFYEQEILPEVAMGLKNKV